MKLYLNDVTDITKSCDEIAETIVCMNGYDKPKYIDPRKRTAGDIGFSTWIDPWFKPDVSSADTGSGTLTGGTYYSIVVAPVDTDIVGYDDFLRGTPTLASIPQASVGGNGISFNIPIHPQFTTLHSGGETAGGGTTIVTDTTQAWSDDELIGLTLVDIETGSEYGIIDNDATTITLDADASLAIGDRYQVVKAKCTRRDVYAAEMAAPANLSGSQFKFQGTVDGNEAAVFTLSSFADTSDFPDEQNIPPDSFSYCLVDDNRVFACGGITEQTGTASVDIATADMQATATLNENIVISLETDYYVGAGQNRVMRFTFGSALTPPTNLWKGSYVTVTNATTPANNIVDARVLRVADNNTWFEIINDTGVAEADVAVTVTISPNLITGTSTIFSEGMLYSTIQLDGESAYTIGWVDTVNQQVTLLEKYEGPTIADSAYVIESKYNVSWSDYGDPHVWRSANSTQIADKPLSLAVFRGLLLVFCRRSLWKVPLNNLYQTPSKVGDDFRFDAPFSVVSTPVGIMFYDGSGFSITDGQSVRSITMYKATDYLRNINPEVVHNIKGVYDTANRRVEYVFPYGTDITNNAGLYITIDSVNVYPFTRMDCNAIWEDEDADGRTEIRHGTSGRHTATGAGQVFSHDTDLSTDGDIGDSAASAIIESIDTAVAGSYSMVVQATEPITVGEGFVALSIPAGASGYLLQFIVKSIVDNTGNNYTIGFSDDWFNAAFEVGGQLLFGVIPIDYGIKWLDFSSPQYQHKVRQVQIDVSNITGTIFIDHFGDLSTEPIHTSEFALTPADTKIIVPLKKGSFYTYGFRLRGYTSTKAEIYSFEVLFDTEI